MYSNISCDGLIDKIGIFSSDQKDARNKILRDVDESIYKYVRVVVPDVQAKLRGKTMLPDAFASGMKDGVEFTAAHFSFDSAEGVVYNPFSAGGGLAMAELEGFSNCLLVPDPLTFREVPWAPGVGWVLGDMYLRDGTPVAFDARHQLKSAIARLAGHGFEFVAGLEVEFYVTRVVDAHLGVNEAGGLGVPPVPPTVEALGRGFAYQSDDHQDAVAFLTDVLAENCLKLGLPLRTMEDEMGPGQLEFTFDVLGALEAADAMVLFRSMVKQVTARMGLHATFMARPKFPGFVASGWHLHQSLSAAGTRNAFATAPGSTDLLSDAGRYFVGGILDHAVEASVFTTPTINGYRRRKPNSLAPDRATWGYDNRAAMVRVQGRPGHHSAHIENRIGEPAANPYLYLASQILSGVDGLERKLDPGPFEASPYEATHRPKLPATLMEAVDALDGSAFFRKEMGESFIDWHLGIKRFEIDRFLASEPNWAENADDVTEWEHREYFTRY